MTQFKLFDSDQKPLGTQQTMSGAAPSVSDLEDLFLGGYTVTHIDRPLTIAERVRDRLFPRRHCPKPTGPGTFWGAMTVRSTMRLNWCDRLRVLVTGIVCFTSRTITEHEIGNSAMITNIYIGTPRRDLNR